VVVEPEPSDVEMLARIRRHTHHRVSLLRNGVSDLHDSRVGYYWSTKPKAEMELVGKKISDRIKIYSGRTDLDFW
jgi:hypothetical protein